MLGKGATFPNLYQAFGGRAACHRLAQAFYARVEHDPVLRPLFPEKSLRCAIEEFSAFLAQFLGGPGEDAQRRWWLSLRESHLRFKIGNRERQAWMANMVEALEEVQVQEPMRSELLAFFEQSSAHVVNQEKAVAITRSGCSIPENGIGAEISDRWKAQTLLDEVVTAIRNGNADRAIELAESQSLQAYGRSTYCGLLALMLRCGQGLMLDYVCAKLTNDPPLAQERYAGRTLLHEAAAAGNLTAVELLLRLGVDPNSRDAGGHTALYCLANECAAERAGRVVRALARAGGDVDADDGVKHCSPLHMAARRGNVEVAEALLNCGANIESRDTLGDTPLRRAVNCDKAEMASLLVARGADIQSKGSKGLTAILAARTTAMKQSLQRAIDRKTRR
jgi:truncated hemoglobin YjbI